MLNIIFLDPAQQFFNINTGSLGLFQDLARLVGSYTAGLKDLHQGVLGGIAVVDALQLVDDPGDLFSLGNATANSLHQLIGVHRANVREDLLENSSVHVLYASQNVIDNVLVLQTTEKSRFITIINQ